MEVVKSKNKQKVDQIDNGVTLSHVVNTTKNKNQNDEIINNNVRNDQQQQQQQKKGKNSNKKKKNKQKNSHNNDKGGDDEMSKQQKEISKQEHVILLHEQEEETTTTINCHDNNHNNDNNLLSVSHEDDELICADGTNLPLNKPFIAPLEPMGIINDDNKSVAAVDSETLYCPLTPRRIVDVKEDESQPQQVYDLKKSNTINSINKVETSSHEITNDNIKENMNEVDDEYYDDEDNDDGDNGLLVQFLDEANRIVSTKILC